MTLGKSYKKATLYPSLIIIFATVIFSIADNYNYKSEWMTASSVIFLSIIVAFINCLVISLLSTTIFLNKIPEIKNNRFLNFLSWFLLPLGFITVLLVHEIKFNIKYHEKFGSGFMYMIILILPFVIGLISSYYKYRKAQYIQPEPTISQYQK